MKNSLFKIMKINQTINIKKFQIKEKSIIVGKRLPIRYTQLLEVYTEVKIQFF